MNNIKLSFLLLLLLSLQTAFNAAFAQGLNARINTDSVVIGDSFQLQLSTDDSASSPDLSPLQKDFTLLGTSQNTSIQIINGTVSQQKTWIISLSPKTTGKLTAKNMDNQPFPQNNGQTHHPSHCHSCRQSE